MNILRHSVLVLPIAVAVAVIVASVPSLGLAQPEDDAEDNTDFMWSCDDMTPDLCNDLVLTKRQVPTQDDLMVTYFHYQKAKAKSKNQQYKHKYKCRTSPLANSRYQRRPGLES